MLNRQKGNMYPFVTHTWNPITGECPHDCSYCYMKVWPQSPLRLNEKALLDNLGSEKTIFVGSSTDMFADAVPYGWITSALQVCNKFHKNKYLFQTKNPKRIIDFVHLLPKGSTIAVTLESNRDYEMIGKAPSINERIRILENYYMKPCPLMISIEPIMDFDLIPFVNVLDRLNPSLVSIGADSKGHNLQEPDYNKLQQFLEEIFLHFKVFKKDNLQRLLRGPRW